ncbi:hypothetical protein BS50DRAFT_640630 [Corynespora cassiicola Philippines]|uniref:Uncharacterized protein n=1 Tax=Corynespora cassiicola Philippines TaxID=1448308 RepID=A0A2T2N3B3_CORCC|nr:hypothetical protein BS50DRAFT_640630 [Corynespora cassiicola Philippines]
MSHTCQSLGPQALENLFLSVENLSMTLCIGISQSGKTPETVTLMHTLRERFDHAGLDYRKLLLWLAGPISDSVVLQSGHMIGMMGFEQVVVSLQMPAESCAVVKAMLTMDVLSVFVSSVTYHRRMGFVTHPKVNLYKRRAAKLMTVNRDDEYRGMDPSSILHNDFPMYLKRNPQTCFVEVLRYGRSPFAYHEEVKAKLITGFSKVIQAVDIEVFQVFVIVVLEDYLLKVEGISEQTICGNIRLLQAIARATYETLYPKAFLLRLRDEFLQATS